MTLLVKFYQAQQSDHVHEGRVKLKKVVDFVAVIGTFSKLAFSTHLKVDVSRTYVVAGT